MADLRMSLACLEARRKHAGSQQTPVQHPDDAKQQECHAPR